MKAETRLGDFICNTRFQDLLPGPLETVKNQLLAVVGTTFAGAAAEGCKEAVRFYKALTQEDHERHFKDCMGFAKKSVSRKSAKRVLATVHRLEELHDIRELIRLLVI